MTEIDPSQPLKSPARRRPVRPRVSEINDVPQGLGASMSQLQDFGSATMMPRTARRSPNTFVIGILAAIIVVVLAGVAGYALMRGGVFSGNRNVGTFKAIFLINGQAYFGTIKHEDAQYVDLDNVFYIQMVNDTTAVKPGDTTPPVQKPQLVKKGDEFYGPANSIRINRSQITVIEELRNDSQVLQQIRAQLAK